MSRFWKIGDRLIRDGKIRTIKIVDQEGKGYFSDWLIGLRQTYSNDVPLPSLPAKSGDSDFWPAVFALLILAGAYLIGLATPCLKTQILNLFQ